MRIEILLYNTMRIIKASKAITYSPDLQLQRFEYCKEKYRSRSRKCFDCVASRQLAGCTALQLLF